MNVLSLFDGMGGARQALRNLRVNVGRYCASEINGPSIAVASHNFPDIFHLGDINSLDTAHLSCISWDLVIFGSPCIDLSVAKKNRQSLAGKSSSLFYRAVDILNALRPKYFLMENVASMTDESRAEITRLLGVEPVQLNSKHFTGQNRERLYWFNWKVSGRLPYPPCFAKHLLTEYQVSDLALSTEALIYMNRTSGSRNHWEFAHHSDTGALFSACVVANFKKGVPYNVLIDRRPQVPVARHFHPIECERLQGFPDDYSAGVAKTHRFEMIGNAFTVDVIQFLLRPIVYGYI